MDLKRCKGIFIDIDGGEHAFGTMKYAHVSDLDDDNYHDDAFRKDILNTEWFKSLGFDYSGNINADIAGLAEIGIITLITACRLNPNGTHYNSYVIAIHENLSDNQRDFLEEEYYYIKSVIDSDQAYLFGEVINDSGENNTFYYLDELYDHFDLRRNKGTKK